MSLIGSVFERKRSGSVKPNAPSVAGRKTGFPPVQHRSKSAFARGRDDARKGDATTSRQVAPPPVIQRNADAEDWREQISRENETRVENMSESERQEEINEIMQRFGSGVGDILRKAKEARQKNTKDELDPVPLTSPTLEERKSPLKRVGSPPPALSTSSTRPSSRAENRKLRFAELTPDDVHVYESAPPSPRKKGPLLLLPLQTRPKAQKTNQYHSGHGLNHRSRNQITSQKKARQNTFDGVTFLKCHLMIRH
ncbi:hypothetical protein PTI98_011446 [Pleurotus ostreatus]|nr:hypothetical protein PTI98_011446 [Pleurotus ostreatus]